MALLNTGRVCDRIIRTRNGEKFCTRRAKHTIKGTSGGELDYCNKHIDQGIEDYPKNSNVKSMDCTERGKESLFFDAQNSHEKIRRMEK